MNPISPSPKVPLPQSQAQVKNKNTHGEHGGRDRRGRKDEEGERSPGVLDQPDKGGEDAADTGRDAKRRDDGGSETAAREGTGGGQCEACVVDDSCMLAPSCVVD